MCGLPRNVSDQEHEPVSTTIICTMSVPIYMLQAINTLRSLARFGVEKSIVCSYNGWDEPSIFYCDEQQLSSHYNRRQTMVAVDGYVLTFVQRLYRGKAHTSPLYSIVI